MSEDVIAGGHRYLHINANGDVDPCVFIHYSDSNIREKSLLETLRSPMMMAYHDNQPFNDNMLRPCPMLENPEKNFVLWLKKQGHIPPTCNLQKLQIIYAQNVISMQETGSQLQINSGKRIELNVSIRNNYSIFIYNGKVSVKEGKGI